MPPIDEMATGHPDLAAPLRILVRRYLDVNAALDEGADASGVSGGGSVSDAGPPPSIAGFRIIERLGAGGMGEVYKAHDLQLDRIVAAKILRRDRDAGGSVDEVVREARALAQFLDPRIVQIFEVRVDADPP